jgi:hypothetical protein
MAMGGMDMGIGQGAAAGGALLNAIGQQEGFRALAKAKKKQRAEQQAIQAEDSADLLATEQNNNPLLSAERLSAQNMQPGQEYLERVRSVGPVGLSVSQQTASAPQMQANQSDLQAANQRLARVTGEQDAQTGLRLARGEFEDRRGGRKAKLNRLAALYDLLDMQAAQKGEGLRSAGNILGVAGGVAGSGAFSGQGQGRQKLFDTEG